MDNETKAKWKRAEEVCGEAADMNPGDAAIMFVIAAVISQKKFYNDVVDSTLNGEAVTGLEEFQDLKTFRAFRSIMGNDFDRIKQNFVKSPTWQKAINDALVRELSQIVHRMVLAVMLKDKVGDKFYDV